jgi:wyosine [tRNA(Phe)-imidazoG37] synthetase (radical SAM superfamily)
MLLELKKSLTYGPVRSRRIGRSLGINLFPGDRKVCSLNCAYCQYGWTAAPSLTIADPSALPSVAAVVEAVEQALAGLEQPPDCITFSGNGEATLHPDFANLVDAVASLRDRVCPSARTAILSNSTRVGDPQVRAALARLDLRIMKLDAGTEETLRRLNGPPPELTLGEVLDGLRALDDVTIQALFVGGPQVYSLDRGYPSRSIEPVAANSLAEIAESLRSAGINARSF